MKKQPDVTNQTRANLRAAFWSLYRENPIEKISIRQITDLAGYNRGTFYLYYRDVYDLFAQIEGELTGVIGDLLADMLAQGKSWIFPRHMQLLAELTGRYSDYVSVLLSDRGDPQFATRLKELIRPLLKAYFSPPPGSTAEEEALWWEFYLSGLLAAITQWLAAKDRMPVEQFIGFILRESCPRAEK